MLWEKGIIRKICVWLLNHCDHLDRAYIIFVGHSWNVPVLLRKCLKSEAYFQMGLDVWEGLKD